MNTNWWWMTSQICNDGWYLFCFVICRSEEIAQCSIKLELINDCFTDLRGEIAGPPGNSPKTLEESIDWTRCLSSRYAIWARDVSFRDPRPGNLSFQSPEGQIPHENLASEYLFSDWSNLLGYFKRQLGSSYDVANSSALTAGTLSFSRTWWSSRCCRCLTIQGESWNVLSDSQTLDECLCKWWALIGRCKLLRESSNGRFISGPHKFPDFDNKIHRLKDMGVSEFDARAALSRHNWDLTRATEQLFS